MQLNTSAATAPTVVVPCAADDFDHAFDGTAAVFVAPAIPLTAVELVAALYGLSPDLTADDLAAMTDDQVRREVALNLAVYGTPGVTDAAEAHLGSLPPDPVSRQHLALCRAKVASAFGVTMPMPQRRRQAAPIAWARTVARAA